MTLVIIEQITGKSLLTLVEMAVRCAGRGAQRRGSRWWHVSEALGQGSTSSIALCRHFDLDPDEQLGGCETCYDAPEDSGELSERADPVGELSDMLRDAEIPTRLDMGGSNDRDVSGDK